MESRITTLTRLVDGRMGGEVEGWWWWRSLGLSIMQVDAAPCPALHTSQAHLHPLCLHLTFHTIFVLLTVSEPIASYSPTAPPQLSSLHHHLSLSTFNFHLTLYSLLHLSQSLHPLSPFDPSNCPPKLSPPTVSISPHNQLTIFTHSLSPTRCVCPPSSTNIPGKV